VLQEDNPAETAATILQFAARQGMVQLPSSASDSARLAAKLSRAKELMPSDKS
jgi:hypothetical protein